MVSTNELQQKVALLKAQVQVHYTDIEEVESKRLGELSIFAHKHFKEVLEKGDILEVVSDRIDFTRPQEGYNYNKELLSLRFNQDWKTGIADKVNTSFYSSSDHSVYELKRMILLGKVGQIVLDHHDNILKDRNDIIAQFKDSLNDKFKDKYRLEREIGEIEKAIREIENEDLVAKAEVYGVDFKLSDDISVRELPTLRVKFDREINYIKRLQIISKTTSGKSANIELTVMTYSWNKDLEMYEYKEQTIEVAKVRMDYIRTFLQYYSKRISAS